MRSGNNIFDNNNSMLEKKRNLKKIHKIDKLSPTSTIIGLILNIIIIIIIIIMIAVALLIIITISDPQICN